MRHRSYQFLFLVLAFALTACAVKTQKERIRDARFGIATAGLGLKASGKVAIEYFENYPSDNTEKYCQGEVALLILKTAKATLKGAADSSKLWETALAIYVTKKEDGNETKVDWSAVLDSDAQWRTVGAEILGALELVRSYLKLAGIEVPTAIDYAWSFLSGFLGGPEPIEPDINWKSLKGGVCDEYLPGGAL